MAFKQDIKINIASGIVALKEPSFKPLIIDSGVAAIGYQIISEANDLISYGYLSTDMIYKMVEAMLAQLPSPQEIVVMRKIAGDSYPDALTALLPTYSDFWGVLTTSVTKADLLLIGSWCNANKRMFIGAVNDVTAGSGRNVSREAFIIHDKLAVAGYQEISSKTLPFVGATVPALVAQDYDIDIDIDGGGVNQLVIAALITDDWDALAAKIQVVLRAATSALETVAIVNGKIKVSSVTTGTESTVVITAGTTGSAGGDLLAYIDLNVSSMETSIDGAVNGLNERPDAALISRKLAREPYKTWKWKKLNGISASDYTLTQLTTIRDNQTIAMQEQAGAIYTNEGITTGGDYIDTIYSIDLTGSKIEIALLGLFLKSESVPLDDSGIPIVEGEIRNVLDSLGKLGIIAKITADSSEADLAKSDDGIYIYHVEMPTRADLSTADKASRKLPYIKFSYTVAGAIHETTVDGTIEV